MGPDPPEPDPIITYNWPPYDIETSPKNFLGSFEFYRSAGRSDKLFEVGTGVHFVSTDSYSSKFHINDHIELGPWLVITDEVAMIVTLIIDMADGNAFSVGWMTAGQDDGDVYELSKTYTFSDRTATMCWYITNSAHAPTIIWRPHILGSVRTCSVALIVTPVRDILTA